MTQAFQDILYTKADGMAWVTINCPQVLNAFRPLTILVLLAPPKALATRRLIIAGGMRTTLNQALRGSAQLHLHFGVLLALGLVLSRLWWTTPMAKVAAFCREWAHGFRNAIYANNLHDAVFLAREHFSGSGAKEC